MASVIYGESGQRVYLEVLRHILKNGRLRAPRGDATLDAGFTVIELMGPRQALPLGLGRELNRNIAAAEAIQLIGGFAQPDLLTRASPTFERFADGGKFHGAYGSRVKYQVLNAITKLQKDPQSRQAVITLWDPWLDNLEGMHDYPCTVMIQFEAASSAKSDGVYVLNMNVMMRSNDAWLGLPYDMFQFGQLQFTVARALGWVPGSYRHTALSLHLYTRDVITAERIAIPGTHPTNFELQPEGIGRDGESFTTLMKRARHLVNVGTNVLGFAGTRSEAWYVERFASYMGPDVVGDGAGDRAAEPVQP